MHKSPLLLLLLLALVGVGFLALRVGSGETQGTRSGWQVPEIDRSRETAPSLPQDADVTLGQVPARPEGGGQGDQRVAENAQTRVSVTHSDGAPFPGVRLVFLDRTKVRGWEKQWDDGRARRTFIRSKGAGFESDGTGQVFIPRTLSGVLCTRNPGLHGEWEWQGSAPLEHTFAVSSISDLHLRVVDSSGRPHSAVAVVLERELKGDHLPVLSGMSTAPGGAVLFPAVRRSLGDPSPGSRFTATFGFPCKNPPRVAFDAFALPEEPLVLTLPPMGSLRVRVYNESGVLMDESVDVSLGRLDSAGVFEGLTSQRLIGGEAVFGHVGVGTRLAVRLGGSRKRPPLIEEISGPVSDGAEEVVIIKWEQLYPVVVGRAVRDGGQVLSSQRGRYTLDRGQGLIGGPPLTTDGEGRFRIVLSSPPERGMGGAVGAEPDRQEAFQLEAALFSTAGQAPYEAVRTFRVPDSGMEYDLGDLVFHMRPLLASGRVTDQEGGALLGVHVRAEEQAPKDKRWSPVRDQSAVTDYEGKYTIHGTPSGLPLRLVAMKRGFRTMTLAGFSHGSSAVDIVLHLAGSPGSGDGKRDRPTRGKPGLVPDRDGGN